MRAGSLEDRRQLRKLAYVFLAAGTLLSLAALSNWQIEVPLSILGVLFIGLATGRPFLRR